jgi:hypothetical protein
MQFNAPCKITRILKTHIEHKQKKSRTVSLQLKKNTVIERVAYVNHSSKSVQYLKRYGGTHGNTNIDCHTVSAVP